MKSALIFQPARLLFLLAALPALTPGGACHAAPTNIYFTAFEPGEGYSASAELVGQGGWLGEGTGGNGIVTNFIPGQGQQAYVGYFPPVAGDDRLVAWQPLNFNPSSASLPLMRFSVLMNITDSSNTNYDNFRWSVYNTQAQRMFSLDFDNYYTDVNYLLDGTNALAQTGVRFTNGVSYTLLVTMNFASNRWSASLDNRLIATNQPITTAGTTLDLGDIDAVWLVYDTNAPGDNYLLFDNYRVTAEALPVSPAQLQFLGRTGEGWALVRVFGQAGSRWAVDATTNWSHWTALTTNVVSGNYFDVVDTTAAGLKQRFYRARLVP